MKTLHAGTMRLVAAIAVISCGDDESAGDETSSAAGAGNATSTSAAGSTAASSPTGAATATSAGGGEGVSSASSSSSSGEGGSSSTGGYGGAGGGGGSSPATGCAVDVAVGDAHACAIRADGSLWCWGLNTRGQASGDGTTSEVVPHPVRVAAIGDDVMEVAVGGGFTCARKSDGTLWCWGLNQDGRLGDGTTLDRSAPVQVGLGRSNWITIAAGWASACALADDGTVWCWGNNELGQLGTLTECNGLSCDRPTPVQAELDVLVDGLSVGGQHACAWTRDGDAWCWGEDAFGALGDGEPCGNGDLCGEPIPRAVTGLGPVRSVAAGSLYTCAILLDGTLWCWGYNGTGQLGFNESVDSPTPGEVPLPAAVADVSTSQSTFARLEGGAGLFRWGENFHGQLGFPGNSLFAPEEMSSLEGDVAVVDVGVFSACAITENGDLWCWGSNLSGALGTDAPCSDDVCEHEPAMVVLPCE